MVQPARVAIVGGGPRGTEILERIAANLGELHHGRPLEIHVIDPYPPGAGKVWRLDQSPLLRLNSMAMDVTLFSDETVRSAGPPVTGPTLAEWAQTVDRDELPVDLRDEADELAPITFPTRRLGGEYLGWVYRRVVVSLPDEVTVIEHRATAIDVHDEVHPAGRQRVDLDDGTSVWVDAVVLTLGHLDNVATGEAAGLADHAARHRLAYLPPAYGTESDLSVFAPGADVIVRGFGLGFVDLLVLMTEGRGGKFVDIDDRGGRLRYESSGAEPVFHIGSRRGVPYLSKLTYELIGPPPAFPRFLTREAIASMIAAKDIFEFRAHAWPLIAKEIAWAAYHELAAAHPDRVVVSWDELDRRIADVEWGTPEWDATIAELIPSPADRLDFTAIDRPLDGLMLDDAASLQQHIRSIIRADLGRRADPHFSADLGAFNAFLRVFEMLPFVLGSPKLSAKSRVQEFDDWWFGFFSYYSSGPPPRRMEELLALSEVGIVQFLGGETWVRIDEEAGTFVAGSATTPDTISARALIDARLPGPSVRSTTSPIVRALDARGEISELVLRESDGTKLSTGQILVAFPEQRIVDAAGLSHPNRYALGSHSTSKAPAFARPRTNSLTLRHNDLAARALLTQLLTQRPARPSPSNGGDTP
ncbi:MAG: FAD/NAD(P)-binding protein [Ilumatobacteraceae bacterium]